MRSFAPLVCCVLVLVAMGPYTATGQATSAATTPSSAEPSIHAVYPDPIAGGDEGEFVVLSVPDGTDIGQYAVTDGDGTVGIPNTSARGRVVLSTVPNRTRELTDWPVVGFDGHLALANGGERIRLQRGNRTVDAVRYTEAVEGELGIVNGSVIRWRPLGATDRPVVRAAGGEVRAFTLPDTPAAPIRPIRNAGERVYLAGYTLSSDRVADALIAAQRRGATVRILLEGEPVGSRTDREAATLDRLTEAGVSVRVLTGPRARYRYHHAKYAIADERAVVLTENWKPAGTGGNSSRGWGVVTSQPRIIDGLNRTFQSDIGWQDSKPWGEYRQGRQFERAGPATGSYPTEFRAESVSVQRTDLLITPDNAQGRLVETIDDADDSIDVIQPTVGDWNSPLLRALRRAASRGVEVRLLLSDAWYVREENEQTAQRFREWADRNDAPLTAKVADPDGRYEKIHAKGAVVDDKRVVVGSLNWNEAAATSNREVVLVLHGGDAADYFGAVFDADWDGGGFDMPVGALVALLGLLVVAGLAARRVSFEA
ncbi:phospholipase D-like domain-containing protein [Haloarcula argentinensis]|uniref:Phospholipase D-like domain-containing protein n=1 Tax=Haloarcula argentinensis TaxID=43776 RepID=A0ABU2F001_HALAR|nr:phospholipase D-like domain-containing protein [Haloarcula argentinensis]EMA18564.1 phospholipase D [Haloarcula argentinensis DSM 12282]MDS0253878.1 phospholipase D-like domain-containing protein [Haloarcula argentinensis]